VASGRFAWRLISQLSLNYLSLKDVGRNRAEGLREILKLYADPRTARPSSKLTAAQHQISVGRAPRPNPRAHHLRPRPRNFRAI